MIFRERLKNLFFWFFMIIFERDDSFISDFNERNKRFSFAIYFRKKSQHFFIFYQFFHRQQSIFQHFHCFSQIVKNDRKLSYVRCDFDYFLFESRKIRIHLLFEMRELSVDTNQFEWKSFNSQTYFNILFLWISERNIRWKFHSVKWKWKETCVSNK